MQNSDYVFYREFVEMMNGRRACMQQGFKYVDLPLPELSTMINGAPKRRQVFISNKENNKITERFYEALNGTQAELVGKTTLLKRQFLSDGSFRKDANGNYVYSQIPVKHECVAILSPVNIGLKRFEFDKKGRKKDIKIDELYRYVDFVEGKDKKRRYIYIIPKKHVYNLNMTALIITPNKHRNFYKGSKIALQNGNYIYLYIIPYKYSNNLSYRVLGVKPSVNFDNEVKQILTSWMGMGVMFNLNTTMLNNPVKGIANLGMQDLEPTLDIGEYELFDENTTLADEKVDKELEY